MSKRPPSAPGVARRRRARALGLSLLLASGCAARNVPAQGPDDGARAAGPPVVTTESQTANGPNRASDPPRARFEAPLLDQKTASDESKRILAEVARTRNLEVTRRVQVDVVDRPGIRKYAKEQMYEKTTPAELRLMGRIESSLGVIPVGIDPEDVILDVLEDGILGFYDPDTRKLFIGDFVPKSMLSMVVGHEIAHGLQDMHFDLKKLQEPIRHHSDRETARTFVIEGEAQAIYLAWVSGKAGLASIEDSVLDALGNQNLDLAGEVSDYPILARSLQMPYADGTATVIRLVRKRGWKAVDALYDDLPQTTEQMLHLDKLLAREPARTVEIDAEPIADVLGLDPVWHDTIGEAGLLSMIAQVEASVAARRSTDGWGGDGYVAFDAKAKPRKAPTVVALVAWDSEADAKQFEASLTKYLDPDKATARNGHTAIEGSFVRRKGDRVLFATHVPSKVGHDALAAAAWGATKVGPKKKGKRRRK